MSIRSLIKGIALLRYRELVSDLGERRFHLIQIDSIRHAFPQSKVNSNIHLINFDPERLKLGQRASVSVGTVLAFGDPHNGFGAIEIKDDTWIGEYNNLRAGGGDIVIGAGCLISQFCTLVASNHGSDRNLLIQAQAPPTDRRGVVLGDDVWLGAGVTITPGVTVNTGAIIGAGSVVTKNVPEYEIWAGVPAKKIGARQ